MGRRASNYSCFCAWTTPKRKWMEGKECICGPGVPSKVGKQMGAHAHYRKMYIVTAKGGK
jgi:hypothetical protein